MDMDTIAQIGGVGIQYENKFLEEEINENK